jgi:tetratricopeptide (TPR) repeat protein
MKKFHSLDALKLSIVNLAGLSSETIIAGNAAAGLGQLGMVALKALIADDTAFRGRNYHEMGEYDKAENYYINSTLLLPERIYPYYLLTKLYADSAGYRPEKMQQAAVAVLEKEPKVHSTAIREMRTEVKKILQEKGVKYE